MKRTRREDGRFGLFSIAAPFHAEVEYFSSRWTVPLMDCGDLAVFGRVEDAMRFQTLQIKARGEFFEIALRPCSYVDGVHGRQFGYLFTRKSDTPHPRGIVYASRVRLAYKTKEPARGWWKLAGEWTA